MVIDGRDLCGNSFLQSQFIACSDLREWLKAVKEKLLKEKPSCFFTEMCPCSLAPTDRDWNLSKHFCGQSKYLICRNCWFYSKRQFPPADIILALIQVTPLGVYPTNLEAFWNIFCRFSTHLRHIRVGRLWLPTIASLKVFPDLNQLMIHKKALMKQAQATGLTLCEVFRRKRSFQNLVLILVVLVAFFPTQLAGAKDWLCSMAYSSVVDIYSKVALIVYIWQLH